MEEIVWQRFSEPVVQQTLQLELPQLSQNARIYMSRKGDHCRGE